MRSVDVIVPCYRYAHFLETCLATVLSQRDVDVRVLIVDDCSPDNTPDVSASLVAADQRISYVRNASNLGLIGTMNRGLEWATAEYVLVLSADDALTAGALARAVDALERHPDASMAYGPARVISGDKKPDEVADVLTPTYTLVEGARFIEISCVVGNPAPAPTAVVRTNLIKQTGGYLPEFPYTSDMEMWMRMATLGSIVAIKEHQAFYRWHGSNMSSSLDRRADLNVRIETCEFVYKKWNGQNVAGFRAALQAMRKSVVREVVPLIAIAIDQSDWKQYHAYMTFLSEVTPSWRWSEDWLRLVAKRRMGWKLRQTSLGKAIGTLRQRQGAGDAWRQGTGDTFGWLPPAR